MKRVREDHGLPGGPKRPNSGVQAGQGGNAGHSRLTTNDALTYLREVKTRFQDQKAVYDTFLEIMKEFKAQRIDTAGVIIRVKDLFKGNKELILGFNTFLPKGYEIELAELEEEERREREQTKQPVEFDQAISYVNKIKQRFSSDERVYKAFLEILNMYRKGQKTINNVYDEVAILFRSHQDLLNEFSYFLPDTSNQLGQHTVSLFGGALGQQRPGRVIRAGPASLRQGQMLGRPASGQSSYNPSSPVTAGPYYTPGYGRREIGRVRDGDLLRRPHDEDEFGHGRLSLDRELQFFDRVKQRLRNREAYQDLLKCMNMFAHDIITRGELIGLVQDIIGRYPDLMSGFQAFLRNCEHLDENILTGAGATRVTLRDMRTGRHLTTRDKMLSKPISELAAEMSANDRCTTSYVRMPSGFPKMTSTGRTQLGNQVLNDTWISIISGSEDYSFKLMRKNQYEEALFRCEDDRYELDLCIDQNASAIRAFQPLVETIASLNAEEKATYRVPEGVLSPIHIRAVERIYADHGPSMADYIRKNPIVAVPVAFTRLQQKDREWRSTRDDMNKMWRKVFEQNYHKSLDHRSFYFKQSDKKNLALRYMMQELRDLQEQNRLKDSKLKSLSAACPQELIGAPDMTFDYSDVRVHDTCYQVVRWAVEEMLTAGSDTKEHIMDFWLHFVEPFFNLPNRKYEMLGEGSRPDRHKGSVKTATDKSDSSDADGEGKAGTLESAEEGITGGMTTPQRDGGVTPEPELGENKINEETLSQEQNGIAEGRGDAEEEGDGSSGEDKGRLAEDSAGRNDVEAEESSDEHPGRLYEHCKPLVQHLSGYATTPSSASRRNVIYCNDSFFFFFRFHRYLFDRLCTAIRCCREKNRPHFRQTGEKEQVLDEQERAKAEGEATKLHNQFVNLLHDVLDGSIDSSLFEDQCRELLGTNSYVLFTLDKLVYKLVKHVQAMMQDDLTCKLWELHKYETSRTAPVNDVQARANARMVLQEDGCFKIAYNFDNSKLDILLLDSDTSELTGSGFKQEFSDYLKSFLFSPAGANIGQIFLHRNLPNGKNTVVDQLEMPSNIQTRRGLEVKISVEKSKITYVMHTEDVLYRKGSTRGKRFNRDARNQRFEAWASGKAGERVTPYPDADADMAEAQTAST